MKLPNIRIKPLLTFVIACISSPYSAATSHDLKPDSQLLSRVEKVQQAARTQASAKPELKIQHLAQWYNWPNWSDWNDWSDWRDWNNWPNY